MAYNDVFERAKTASQGGLTSVDEMVWPALTAPPVTDPYFSPDNATGPPFATFTSTDGVTVRAFRDPATQTSGASGDYSIRQQTDDANTTWEGNFTMDATAVFNRTVTAPVAGGNQNQIELRFSAAFHGVGCQGQRNSQGDGWTFEMRAYDAETGGNLLHSASRADGLACQAPGTAGEASSGTLTLAGTFGANDEMAFTATPIGTGIKPTTFFLGSSGFGFLATDDGAGNIVALIGSLGSGGTHTIDYATGAFSTSSSANPVEPISYSYDYFTGVSSCPESSAIFLGIAADAGGVAAIRRVEVNVRNTVSGVEEPFAINFLTFGPFDPLTSVAPASPSRCFATSPGTGVPFSLSRGLARHGRVIAIAGRDELLISDGVETLGVHLRGTAWRAIGRGCTGLFYEPDTDAMVASFGTATYELEREGALTDNGSGLALTVETPAVASDAAVPMRLQRLYVESDTRGQSVVPTLVLDETTIVLAAFVTTARTTVEYALDVSARVAGVRLNGAALADRVDVFGVDLDYYVPEGEPGASFTIPEAPMMMDA